MIHVLPPPKRVALLLVPCLWWSGCGTETGNPEGLDVRYNARSTRADVGLREGGDAMTVDQVWLRLTELSVQGCEGDTASVDGIGFADHAPSTAALQELELPFSEVCGLSVRLASTDQATGEPDAFAGTSVGIGGVLADGRRVEIALGDPVAVELDLPAEPVADQGGWLVTFDVGTWLDPDVLAASPDDLVRIDATTDPALHDRLVDGLADGVHVHHDANADGQVDPDEVQLDVRR